jgi:flagellar hook-basal body complex protein FliE
MSDPISAVANRAFNVGQTDGLKRYTVDIGKGDDTSFGDTLTKAINQVSDAQDRATDYTQKLINGESVELHQVMAATEEAGLALELMIELRNKFSDAYRTIINMQS